jgi:hypothetical protein
VGFAVFRAGELVCADIFDSKELFAKVADKLLRSYAMTAVQPTPADLGPTPSCPIEDPRIVEDAIDVVNEDPTDRPNEDCVENPNDDPSDCEAPRRARSGSAVGLGGGIGGGGAGRAAAEVSPREYNVRVDCRRKGSERSVHIGIYNTGR